MEQHRDLPLTALSLLHPLSNRGHCSTFHLFNFSTAPKARAPRASRCITARLLLDGNLKQEHPLTQRLPMKHSKSHNYMMCKKSTGSAPFVSPRFRPGFSVCVALVLACLTACQSSSHMASQRPGGFVREIVSNSVFVAEYHHTKSGDLTDVREYRLEDQMPVLVLVDKNHDGHPDLLIRQDSSTGCVYLLMMSDTDFDGRYDTFAIPGIMTLKDLDGDGWPEDYWKDAGRPAMPSLEETKGPAPANDL